MSLTPEQEGRVREIATEVALAVARVQAELAANRVRDRLQVLPGELEAFLAQRAEMPGETGARQSVVEQMQAAARGALDAALRDSPERLGATGPGWLTQLHNDNSLHGEAE